MQVEAIVAIGTSFNPYRRQAFQMARRRTPAILDNAPEAPAPRPGRHLVDIIC